jgi:enoyl-CoA hydratase
VGDLCSIESKDGIAVVHIDRPPANALDPELGRALIETAEQLAGEPPRAAILTGTGGFFCAGLDLKLVPTLSGAQQREMVLGVSRLVHSWCVLPCPVVCAVNGHAIAGGLVLALTGDYRVGCPVGKIGLTEVRVGVPYPLGAMAIVRHELEPASARVLTLAGRLVEPAEALKLGVLDELVEAELLLERAVAVADELASSPPDTYARVKRQVRGPLITELERIVRDEDDPLLEDWLSEDVTQAASGALRSD